MTQESLATITHHMIPRRRATSEIKLLRLELIPHGKTPIDGIGCDWSPAQPTENLSPQKAALALGIEPWVPASVVKKRYRTLQLRYPPDQFVEKHALWRPSVELLGNPNAHLNWYWQSGLTPNPTSQNPSAELWDKDNVESPLTPQLALQRLL